MGRIDDTPEASGSPQGAKKGMTCEVDTYTRHDVDRKARWGKETGCDVVEHDFQPCIYKYEISQSIQLVSWPGPGRLFNVLCSFNHDAASTVLLKNCRHDNIDIFLPTYIPSKTAPKGRRCPSWALPAAAAEQEAVRSHHPPPPRSEAVLPPAGAASEDHQS